MPRSPQHRNQPRLALEALEQRSMLAVVLFDPYAAGDATKSVGEWGLDSAWADESNVRRSVENIGLANVDVVRVNFYLEYPLNGDGSLPAEARTKLDTQLALAGYAPGKPIAITPSIGDDDPSQLDQFGATHASYLTNIVRNGTGKITAADPDTNSWIRLMKSTMDYIDQETGRSVSAIEPFNEPDFWKGQGTAEQLNAIMAQMVTDSAFNGMLIQGASTLASENAYYWYDRIRGPANSGTTHLLGSGPDALTSYAGFFPYVNSPDSPDDIPYNPEVHSMAELVVGADRGMEGGIFWGAVERPRALFVQASDGERLGYAEELALQNAAAVYRAPDGQIYAFTGGIERAGTPTQYQFTSTAGPVYYNGVGPITTYSGLASPGQDTAIEIATSAADALPAVDGYRWKIINRATGDLLDVFGASTVDGGNISLWEDNGGSNQLWNIGRLYSEMAWYNVADDYLYLSNANSGRFAEVQWSSLDDNANVQQWGTSADNLTKLWYLESTGDGYVYIRNANSNKYLAAASNAARENVVQSGFDGSALQQWELVLSNPDTASGLQYGQDNAGTFSAATVLGSPVTTANPANAGGPGSERSMTFDGVDDVVQLSSTVANTADLTVAAWVNWAGGDQWQRIFDFGNDTNEYMYLTPSSGGDTLRFEITVGSWQEALTLEAAPLAPNEWHHVAVTLGSNTGILYVDGVPVTAGQIPLNTTDFNPTVNFVGKSQYDDPLFQGAISDFGVYNFALSPDQIAEMAVGARRVENLHVSDRTPTSVTLNWDSWEFADGYRVEASGDGANWTFLGDAGAGATTWTESGLTKGSERFYRVLPFNAYGEGVWATGRAATPDDASLSPWTSVDIGAVGGPGAAISTGGDAWELIDAGGDIWNQADSFHFLYQELTGDAEIITKVDAQETTHEYAKAGVMIRDSLAAGSAHATAVLTPSHGAEFSWRTTANDWTADTFAAGLTAPHWVRLVRQGDTFTAYESSDGATWTTIGTQTITMTDTVYVGLAQTSHATDNLNTSSYSNVAIDNVNDPPSAVTLINAESWISEATDMATRKKVADILITDDAIGTNTMSLSGDDADSFELDGTVIYLKAGTVLDHSLQTMLDLTLTVQDQTITGSSEVTTSLSLAVVAADETVVEVAAGDSVTSDTYAGSAKIAKIGHGTLVFDKANSHTGGMRVLAGEVVMKHAGAMNAGPLTLSGTAKVTLESGQAPMPLESLSLAATALLDLGEGGVTVAAGGYDAALIRQALIAGRNGGSWNGTKGIMSSTAAGVGVGAAAASSLAVGYVVAGDNSVTVRYTADGDAQLDGEVNFDDILALFPNYGADGAFIWQEGDFTYDGKVNFDDILALFPNYGAGSVFGASGAGLSGGGSGSGTGFLDGGGAGTATTMVMGPEPPSDLPQASVTTLRRDTQSTPTDQGGDLDATSLAFAGLVQQDSDTKKKDDSSLSPGLSATASGE